MYTKHQELYHAIALPNCRRVYMSLIRDYFKECKEQQKSSSSPNGVVGFYYFQAAMLTMLLIGAFWGTLLLWKLSGVKEFIGMNLFEVNAHGQGQVYGWLCLALMGACYLTLASKSSISFSYAPLTLILFGISFNMAGLFWLQSPMTTFVGGLFIVAAALLFSLQVYPCLSEMEKGAPPFLLAALLFFFVSALYSLWHHYKIGTIGIEAQVFQQVATFQSPLRDLQIHGAALFFSIGLFSTSKSWKGFWLLLFGVIGEAAFFLAYRMTGQTLFASFLILPWLSLLIGILLLRLPFRWPRRWLLLSLGMLLVLPLYSLFSHQSFSHAYYGAIRHAVTVGCFSQLALFLMPIRNGSQLLFSLAAVLLNLGCLSRVTLQILTDFHPIGFTLIPLSGAIEFTALMMAYQAFSFVPFKRIFQKLSLKGV